MRLAKVTLSAGMGNFNMIMWVSLLLYNYFLLFSTFITHVFIIFNQLTEYA